jgi:hypothetical protein
VAGYHWDSTEFASMLLQKFFAERTEHETRLLIEYLLEHHNEYDSIDVSVRVGAGVQPDPSFLPGVQRQAIENSRKRIDMVGYSGRQATIVELKTTVSHAVMGQLLMDRALWIAEHPEDPEPRLVAVGRRGTEQDIGVLNAHGIDVFIYDEAAPATPAPTAAP